MFDGFVFGTNLWNLNSLGTKKIPVFYILLDLAVLGFLVASIIVFSC